MSRVAIELCPTNSVCFSLPLLILHPQTSSPSIISTKLFSHHVHYIRMTYEPGMCIISLTLSVPNSRAWLNSVACLLTEEPCCVCNHYFSLTAFSSFQFNSIHGHGVPPCLCFLERCPHPCMHSFLSTPQSLVHLLPTSAEPQYETRVGGLVNGN